MIKENIKFLLPIILSLLLPAYADADTIILKNGEKIENVRTWEEGRMIKCYRFGSVIGYLKDNVAYVEKQAVKQSEPFFPVEETGQIDDKTDDFEENDHKMFRVLKVYDGDSFKASDENLEIMIRIAGIDAPENGYNKNPDQPYGRKAGKYLENMILNKNIRIKGYGMGGYGRQLAEVFSGNKNAGLEMVKAGLAEVYQGKMPKGFDPEPYRKAEMEAKKSRRGMWSLGKQYISPGKWRKTHKR